MQQNKIIIKGARQNNLKNISFEMPRNELVVITGLSGSGKSSLAFDTIFAEGQRRYVESLSSYARQFLEMMQKPDVDSIEGLSPAISIEQKTTSRNPRSTVGTVTEIYDYMRLLWARIGIPYSPATGLPIESQTVSQMVDMVTKMEKETKIFVMAPVVRGRKGEYRKEMMGYRKKGFQRIKIDNIFYELDDIPTLDKNLKHNIAVVVDRLVINYQDAEAEKEFSRRCADSIEQALKLSEGLMTIEEVASGKQHIFSERFSCPESGFTIEEIEPRLFSFNSPHGACPACGGIGEKRTIDELLLVPNDKLSLLEGALQGWGGSNPAPWYRQTLETLCQYFGGDLRTPYRDLPSKTKKAIIHGTKEALQFQFHDGVRKVKTVRPFEGIIHNLERRYRETESNWIREDIERYMSIVPCGDCHGQRLKPESLAVKVHKKNISEITALSINKIQTWFKDLPQHLNKKHQTIAERILREINERLQFLHNVGLEYLSLARSAGSLSGGESQRIRLASQIGSGLTGVLYVLDEPSIGLHQRDNARLLATLENLRDLGNTVIVVEHDEEAMRHADFLIDVGPGAGVHGGHLVALGKPSEVLKSKDSITAQYLSGKKQIPVPKKRRKGNGKILSLHGAKSNNLKNVAVEIPLSTFTCVTGVSGSGKSTLILETLYPALSKALMGSSFAGLPYDKLENSIYLDKVIDIDQSPIGRTPRSNPATYTGLFTPIRDWYTNLPEAKERGYGAGRFSFNVKGGRCEACQGDGVLKIEMHFLPDVYVTCDQCRGKRYNRETLDITWRDKNIFDVLDMTVEEGHDFFSAVPFIKEKLETLERVGLGYIKIGQSATTLSGGEAQRIKLAKELSRKATGKTIYILDEPTTGLHIEDVRKLLDVLQALVEQGNSVVVIEHNLEVIKCADWVIDMGPEGGDKGGEIVAVGSPEDIAKSPESLTGDFLKSILKGK
ncbi:MAG: excinuclease ABC subunit UvrA [Alphaproteobacteria bacterium]